MWNVNKKDFIFINWYIFVSPPIFNENIFFILIEFPQHIEASLPSIITNFNVFLFHSINLGINDLGVNL